MTRQTTITLSDYTNFLAAGAILRFVEPIGERGTEPAGERSIEALSERNVSKATWILSFGDPQRVDRPKDEGFSVFCPPFYDVEGASATRFKYECRLTTEEFKSLCGQFLKEAGGSEPALTWQEPDLADFSKAFAHTQQLIGQGQLDKTVPCVFARAEGTMSEAYLAARLYSLADAPANLHVYGHWQNGEGILGATPEILFEKKNRWLSTMALAGTLAKATHSHGEHLLKDKKERHENQVVVDDLVQQLKPLGSVRVGPLKVLELPTLWHLIADINVELNEDVRAVELAQRLHPTPALGIGPRRFGFRWMREWPGQQGRGRFGAPFMMQISENHWLCLVAIRNLQWGRGQFLIGSGCGVVKESQLEREWLELFYKRESVKKVLGIK